MKTENLFCFWHQNLWPYQKSNQKITERIQSDENWLSDIQREDPLLWILFSSHQDQVIAEWKRLLALGIEIITINDHLFPRALLKLVDPPLSIQIKGLPRSLDQFLLQSEQPLSLLPVISVVGSRNPTSMTVEWIRSELRQYLSESGWMTVSGGAIGVDQEVHRLSAQMNLSTLVVLPSGLGEIYPANLRNWENAMIEAGGLLVSEFSYQTKMHKRFFHHRNRLIAGFSRATLVLQAQVKSGSMMTAFQAANHGRDVLVVPGHPMDTYYGGSLQLLSQGATLIRNAQDLCDFMA